MNTVSLNMGEHPKRLALLKTTKGLRLMLRGGSPRVSAMVLLRVDEG